MSLSGPVALLELLTERRKMVYCKGCNLGTADRRDARDSMGEGHRAALWAHHSVQSARLSALLLTGSVALSKAPHL